jgi:hypothetical protein
MTTPYPLPQEPAAPDCSDAAEEVPVARPARAGEEDTGRAAPPMNFSQDVRRALTPRVKLAVLVCILVSLGAAPLIGGASLFASLGFSGATYIKILFCVLQPPLAITMVMAISDRYRNRITKEGFIAVLLTLASIWGLASLLLALAKNWARYGM